MLVSFCVNESYKLINTNTYFCVSNSMIFLFPTQWIIGILHFENGFDFFEEKNKYSYRENLTTEDTIQEFKHYACESKYNLECLITFYIDLCKALDLIIICY